MTNEGWQRANEIKKDITAFNRAICYSYLVEGEKTKPELAKLMNLPDHTISEYCSWLKDNNFITGEYKPSNFFAYKIYEITSKRGYPYPKSFLESKDPRRDYFDYVYRNVHQELRDAIYSGKISIDIIRTHKEADSDHWKFDKTKKSSRSSSMQSSLGAGEYVV